MAFFDIKIFNPYLFNPYLFNPHNFKMKFEPVRSTSILNCLIDSSRVTYQDLESKFSLTKKTITPPYWN